VKLKKRAQGLGNALIQEQALIDNPAVQAALINLGMLRLREVLILEELRRAIGPYLGPDNADP
jgi:hypothetical protein